MSNTRQTVLDDLNEIFAITDVSLNEWSGEGCLQFPNLLKDMAIKMNWNEKQLREADPIVRFYVRKHPDWYVTRGAHGGIMRVADRDKKEADKQAKLAQKAKVRAETEAKLGLTSTTSVTPSTDIVSE